MAYSSLRSIEGPTKPRKKVRRKSPPPVSVTATLGSEGQRETERAARRARKPKPAPVTTVTAELGGEGQRATERAAKKAERQERRRARQEKRQTVARHARQREKLHRLREERIPKLERRAARQAEPDLDFSLTERPLKGDTKLAETLGKLDAARTEAGRLGSLVETRRGRRAEPVTALEAGTAIVSAVPGVGLGVRGGALAAKALGVLGRAAPKAGQAVKGAPKVGQAIERAPKPTLKPTPKAAPRPKPSPKPRKAPKPKKGRDPIELAERPPRIPRTRPQAKAKAKATYKARKPAVLSKAGRGVKRRQRITGLAHAGMIAGPAAALPAGIAKTTGEAFVEEPVETLKTTARVLPALAAGVVGTAKDVGSTAVRAGGKALGSGESWEDVLDPVEGEAKAQVNYWKTLGDIAEGDKEAVQQELGLVPVISGGLTGLGVAKALGRPKPYKGPQKVPKKIRDKLDDPDPEVAARGERELDNLMAKGPTYRQGRKGRKEAAVAAGAAGERERAIGKVEVPKRTVKAIGKLGRKKIGKDKRITMADAIQVIGRRGINLDDPNTAIARLRTYRASLREPDQPIKKTAISTRNVVGALIEELEANPRLLEDRNLHAVIDQMARVQRGRQEEFHRERLGEQAEGPDPELERRRLMHVGEEEGIRTPEQRATIRTRYQKLRARGVPAAQAGAKALEAVGREGAKREARQEMRRPFKRAEFHERRAGELTAEGKLREADVARRQAVELRRQGVEASARDRDAFIEETLTAIERNNYAQPIYFRELDVSKKGRLNVLPDFPGGQIPAMVKRNEGILSAEGRIDESGAALFHNLYATRRAMEIRRLWKNFVRLDRREIDGQTVFTGDQVRALEQAGKVPQGYKLMPLQEFERVLKRGKWEDLANMTSDAALSEFRYEIHSAKAVKGKKYIVVPEAKLVELRKQMQPPNTAVKWARVAGYMQSGAMLATSPAWFAFQLVASPFAAMVAHPNPVRWARVTKQMLTEWRKADPKDRAAFRSLFGGTDTDILMRRQVATGLEPDTSRDFSRAMEMAAKTPAGRVLHATAQNLKAGGPLMAANRKYEAYVRVMTGLMEMDKVHHPPRVKRLIGSIAKLNDTTRRHVDVVSKLPFEQQIQYYARHSDAEAEIGQGVRDTLGDWVSLSSKERALAAVTVFYPFIRFSLNWVFRTFPRRHPIKAAIILNLAAQNAQEYEELIGGQPSFFSKYGIAVTHTGEDGEPIKGIDTARFNPGANALVEAIGKGDINAATLTRPLQPVFGVLKSAIESYDPYTGEPTDTPAHEAIAAGILGLSPVTRPVSDKIKGERSGLSQLFDQLAGRDRSLLENLTPRAVVDLRREREAAGVGRLLEASEDVDIDALIQDVIKPRVQAGESPKKVGGRVGYRAAKQELASQAASKEISRILEAEGLADDPEIAQAIDEFFSVYTPASFGNKPTKPGKVKRGGSIFESGGGGGSVFKAGTGQGSIFK